MTQIVGVFGPDKNPRDRHEKSKHERFLSFVHTIQIVCVCVCVCVYVCVCVCVFVCVSLFIIIFPFFFSHTHFLSPPLPSANFVHWYIARQFHGDLEDFSVLTSY